MIILGAGLSGLICGAINAQAQIYERNPRSVVGHRAVLRFRDDRVSKALGIPFRRVTVRKSIWFNRKEVPASLRMANLYSQKVRGIVGESSIWNLESAHRWVAPDGLQAELADICGARVQWERAVNYQMLRQIRIDGLKVVSTIPLPFLIDTLGVSIKDIKFEREPIVVSRYSIPNCDVYQTVYFPTMEFGVYRASITGSLLTIEHVDTGFSDLGKGMPDSESAVLSEVCAAFGLQNVLHVKRIEADHAQAFGKITPIADQPRKNILHMLTQQFGIYSLGRFATWRNILLDDVLDDITAIRRMMLLGGYDAKLESLNS